MAIEFGISRHAPKEESETGKGSHVFTQEVSVSEFTDDLVQESAAAMLERLEAAEEGTLLVIEPSNVARAEQTRQFLKSELETLLLNQEAIEMLTIGDSQEAALEMLKKIQKNSRKKFIIPDLRPTWLIGFHKEEPAIVAANIWKKKLGGDENLLGRFWALEKSEQEAFANELEKQGIKMDKDELDPSELEDTPEDQAVRFLTWMKTMIKLQKKYFPERPVILEAISHNLRADFTLLQLLGEDISQESIERVLSNTFRQPLERAAITVEDNKIQVGYRGQGKIIDDDLENIIEGARTASRVRKDRWQRDFKIKS
jgi:hypothetical protein